MNLSRRNIVKLGLGAGALPLAMPAQLFADAECSTASDLEDQVQQARPLPLQHVRLTGGPLAHAQQLNAKYLLELEPDRMLALYRERAGLAPRAEPYAGWDGPGRNLTGHIAGHYLSAVSLMYAATGDAAFKQRADYIVDELKVVQDRHGDGFLSAQENARQCFDEIARGEIRAQPFDLNGLWVPWYTSHKTYAGLRDAYRFTGNRTALDVEIAFAAWAEKVLAKLDDAQLQRMLGTEFGGMNEILVDLYADTGDRRWLDLSYKFEHRAFIVPLQRHQDVLGGLHGNTNIPKIVGSADRFAYTGRPGDLMAASFFWDRVVQHHSFATGGHGKDEYWGPADRLNELIDGRTAETCNVYNMLKLTRRLFAFRPDAHYADFQERALFNHILASMDPEDGRTSYMVPVGRGVQHEYQNMFRSFTCCVGSGMESHALHGDGIYFEGDQQLWVNLYTPSTAQWEQAGLQLATDTTFPEGETAKLSLTLRTPREFTLSLRKPYWAGDGFVIRINGEPFVPAAQPEPREEANVPRRRYYESPYVASSYIDIQRTWRSGDVVEVTLPKSLRLEPLPDNPRRVAVLWGPLVLAGDLGPEPERGAAPAERSRRPEPPKVPVFVSADQPVTSWLKPATAGAFRSDHVGREPDADGNLRDVDFVPFYRLHRRTYSTYWDLFTPAEWEKQKAAYSAEAERKRKLEAATVAYLEPGETIFEREFNYQAGDGALANRIQGRPGRTSRTWFSYDVPVEPAHPMTLLVTYFSDDRRYTPAAFDILVNDRVVRSEVIDRSEPVRFFDQEIPLPAELVAGKTGVTVRFQAKSGSQIATVFAIRMIRADAPR